MDTVRVEDGLLKEHWDVIEDEVSRESSVSGLPISATRSPRNGEISDLLDFALEKGAIGSLPDLLGGLIHEYYRIAA